MQLQQLTRALRGQPADARRKFTNAEVRGILVDPRTNNQIADEFGVTGSCVAKIRRGLVYKEVHRAKK